jgi:hypothetical protein
VNTLSAYAAAQEAVKGFDKLPENVKKTFIFTGNKGNTVVRINPSESISKFKSPKQD